MVRSIKRFLTICLPLLISLDVWAISGWSGAGHIDVRRVDIQIEDASKQAEFEKWALRIRRTFGLYPGIRYGSAEVDLAVSRLKRAYPHIRVDVRVLPNEDGGENVVVLLGDAKQSGSPPPDFATKLTYTDDKDRYLKLRLGLKGAFALSANQWFGNGGALTEFNPRGKFDGGNGPNGVLDLAPSIGVAAALPVGQQAQTRQYVYGSLLYLGASSIGQDNNRQDFRATAGWEEAFAGFIMASQTDEGDLWHVNISYGRQPYCIGSGMLLCQIASSGGDRAADFAWPRWSGKKFTKFQIRWNDTRFDAFRFSPNDFPDNGTTYVGANLDQQFGNGWSGGLTALKSVSGALGYYLPDGRQFTRDGLRVVQVRGARQPNDVEGGVIAKLEYGQQTHDAFDMRAVGYAAEAGWQFNSVKTSPRLTYRYSRLSGDDPRTERYERWDLLHSGNDIDTWVQGQLMKNIQYNSNVRVHRLLARNTPAPTWRLTGAFSHYQADTENNLGGVISQLGGRNLGNELLFVAENYQSKSVYWRFTFASLWPGSGVTQTLTRPVKSPWLVGIAQFNVNY